MPNLVQRFVRYISTLLTEIEPLLDTFMPLFRNPNEEEYTLQQYEGYRIYEQEISKKMDKFAQDEQFETIEDCMEEINHLVEEDNKLLTDELQVIYEQLQKTKSEEGVIDISKKEDQFVTGQTFKGITIFHRMSLEEQLEMVCNVATFEVFAMMMKMRVEHEELLKELHRLIEESIDIPSIEGKECKESKE